MRVAVIADIHGNVAALDAVEADLRDQAVDEVLVGGDLVGRGPDGRQVARRVRELGWRSVRGNHEDYLIDFARRNVPDAWLEDEEWAASRWMAADLESEDLAYLAQLPDSLTATSAPGLRLVHGTPASNNDGIGSWTSEDRMRRHFDAVREELLVCAHTHRPLQRTYADGQLVNVGSVGLPFNGDRRAQYAIFEHAEQRWSTRLRQVEYDLERTKRRYEESGFRRHGGATAELLLLEIEHAEPFLFPFLAWASKVDRRPTLGAVDDFLAVYRPGESLREFFARL